MPIAIPEIKNVLYFIVTITTKKIHNEVDM